jgi:hypothetical protein
MSFKKDLQFGWDMIWHPSKYAKRKLSVSQSLKLYYQIMILPFIAYVLLTLLGYYLGFNASNAIMPSMSIPLFTLAAGIGFGIVYLFILLPLISIPINAAIYQVVGKHFLKSWNGDYAKTFSAIMMGTLPLVIFFWLLSVPVVKFLFIAILGIWSLVVLVIALSTQQGISRLSTATTLLLTVLFVLLVIFSFISGLIPLALRHFFTVGRYVSPAFP